MHQEGGRPGHNPHFVVPIHLACPSHMTGESGEHPPSARSASAPRLVDIGAFTYKAREISSANLQVLRHNILGTTILRLTPQPFMSSFSCLHFCVLYCMCLQIGPRTVATVLRGARFQDGFYARLVVCTPSGLPLTLSVNKS